MPDPVRQHALHRVRDAELPRRRGGASNGENELLQEEGIALGGHEAAFRHGEDIHTATASAIWDIPITNVTKEQRRAAKAINFGIIYGMGPRRLAQDTGVTLQEAAAFIDKYFTGTTCNVGGIDVFAVAEEAIRLHQAAFGADPVLANALDAGGEYAFRIRGEEHMWTPDAIAKLQHSTRSGKFETYKEYAKIINDQSQRHMTLRGLFELS
mgnify:CR=1 FL=1